MTQTQTKNFVLAGKAIFTVSNGREGALAADYTYKVTRKELDSWDGRNPTTKKPVYFAALLTGSDNENDYTYLGVLDPASGVVKPTAKSRFALDAKPFVALNWALGKVWRDESFPGTAGLKHAGKCGKCARTLTVPESIESGLGPECSGLGYTKPRNERTPRAKKAPKPTFAEQRAAATVTDPASFSMGLAEARSYNEEMDAELRAEREANVGGEIDPEYDDALWRAARGLEGRL